MENEKTPLYVAFSTQKGGVGKTTFTVLAASYLYYLKGYDVAVVDCDYPQHSIAGMRKRDAEQVGADEDYKRMAYEQFTRLGKKAYPVLCSSPEKAIATADEHIAAGHVPDIMFFDLPGTVNSVTPDPVCGPQIRLKPAKGEVRYALSNSFGFGGTNGSLIFKKV